MTSRESKGNVLSSNSDNSIGITPANDFTKVADVKNGEFQSDLALPLSLTSSSARLSKSKVIKKHAIHLIRFCLKSGISENNNIIQFLKENEVILPGRTFDRYKSLAEKELETDLDADIWLSNKVQDALVSDYKDISDRNDRQLALDDMLTYGLIMQAIDKAIEQGQPPGKYYTNLDVYSIIRLQEASNQQKNTTNKTGLKDGELDLSSLHSQSATSYSKPLAQSSCDKNPSQKDEYPQDYLDRYDLLIGMAGKPIKRYLAEIEKKIGKPMSSI
jgi:hypothetical protein